MTKPSIKEFHRYITENLRKEIFRRYRNFFILSEADLQSHTFQILSDYFRDNGSPANLYKVLNKPYLKDLGIHPDIVVFRRSRPWIVIELKEGKRLRELAASKEVKRLYKVREYFLRKNYVIRRGYLFHVSRYNTKRKFRIVNNPGEQFLWQVPVILEEFLTTEEIREWEKLFRKWAIYVSNPNKEADS